MSSRSADGAEAVRYRRETKLSDATAADGASKLADAEPGTLGTASTRRIGKAAEALQRHTMSCLDRTAGLVLESCTRWDSQRTVLQRPDVAVAGVRLLGMGCPVSSNLIP